MVPPSEEDNWQELPKQSEVTELGRLVGSNDGANDGEREEVKSFHVPDVVDEPGTFIISDDPEEF